MIEASTNGNQMKTLTNPSEAVQIWKTLGSSNGKNTFMLIANNFEMRKWISSFGFRATRELADEVFLLRDGT